MKKHPKQVGMSCKNTKFIKKGLTDSEKEKVMIATSQDKARWQMLLNMNKWTEIK